MIYFDLPMEKYLASSNAGNHQLKDFSISPRLYFDKYVAHKDIIELDDGEGEGDDGGQPEAAKESKARVFGIAFEMYMDEPREFDKEYIQTPLKQPDGEVFKTTKVYGKAWVKEQKAAGRVILTPKEFAAMREMKLAFSENADAVELLSHCKRQVTMDCLWPPPIEASPDVAAVTLQSRPDYVCFTGCSLSQFRPYTVDLKTVDAMPRMYTRRVMVDYGYDNQAEIARICMTQNKFPGSAQYILACEKSSPHRCVVFELENEFLDACSEWVFNNCVDLAHCLETGSFPRSRESGIIIAKLPAWKKVDEV